MDTNCGQWGVDVTDDMSVSEYRRSLKKKFREAWDLVSDYIPVCKDPLDAIAEYKLGAQQSEDVDPTTYPVGTWFYYPGDRTVYVRTV